jgi:hypothetical protein
MVMKFTNNATSTLAAGIASGATSLTVATGDGSKFPTLSAGDYFYCTLANVGGTIEIIKVTARSTDSFTTIVRGQDGTSAVSWSTGDKVELRLVSASLNDIPKLDETNTFTAQQTFSGTAPIFSTLSGLVKANSSSTSTAATAGTDYLAPPSGTAILKANSGGALANATAGTDYVAPGTTTNFTKQQYFGNSALTDAATISWDVSSAQVATFTFVSSNRTMGAPTNLVNGGYYGLAVIQNGGSNTLTWNSVFKWTGGVAPTLSTAASAKDYFVFRSDGTNLYEQGRSLAVA